MSEEEQGVQNMSQGLDLALYASANVKRVFSPSLPKGRAVSVPCQLKSKLKVPLDALRLGTGLEMSLTTS